MNIFKKTFASLAVATSLLAVAPANAGMLAFFDTDGAGANAATFLQSGLVNLSGTSLVQNSAPSMTGAFTFNEFATFQTDRALAPTVNFPANPLITSTFTGSGTGQLNAMTTGTLSFTSGTLVISSGMTNIGTFNLVAGTGILNTNSTVPQGTLSIIFQATSLTSGYFFDSAMTDLSSILATNPLIFGFATTNALPLTGPIDTTNPALRPGFNAAFDPDILATNGNGTSILLISNEGQFSVQIPEPGSLALLGIGLLGLAVGSRRKQA